MKHIYSNHLVAYLFDEIDSDTKYILEEELKINTALAAELKELKESFAIIKTEKPLSPNPKIIEHILETSKEEASESITTH